MSEGKQVTGVDVSEVPVPSKPCVCGAADWERGEAVDTPVSMGRRVGCAVPFVLLGTLVLGGMLGGFVAGEIGNVAPTGIAFGLFVGLGLFYMAYKIWVMTGKPLYDVPFTCKACGKVQLERFDPMEKR